MEHHLWKDRMGFTISVRRSHSSSGLRHCCAAVSFIISPAFFASYSRFHRLIPIFSSQAAFVPTSSSTLTHSRWIAMNNDLIIGGNILRCVVRLITPNDSLAASISDLKTPGVPRFYLVHLISVPVTGFEWFLRSFLEWVPGVVLFSVFHFKSLTLFASVSS